MLVEHRLKAKVCLIGEHEVGKTSLIRRFVLDEFDDEYIITLGAKVSKKELTVRQTNQPDLHMDMTVWDIMGSRGFRELLREAYFYGAQGVLAVCDLTREETLDELDDWMEGVFKTIGEVPVILVVNKKDLEGKAAFTERQVEQAAAAFDCPYFYTSAKTGDNVETIFRHLGLKIAHQVLA